ncbi:hypothetical protein Sjap_011300 [Stephania japonica]|uniref:Uncharacterized protein n=1 Tax=Stephania japonica TaxID=461633 RepID=A0AAP0JB92_9MAGN
MPENPRQSPLLARLKGDLPEMILVFHQCLGNPQSKPQAVLDRCCRYMLGFAIFVSFLI